MSGGWGEGLGRFQLPRQRRVRGEVKAAETDRFPCGCLRFAARRDYVIRPPARSMSASGRTSSTVAAMQQRCDPRIRSRSQAERLAAALAHTQRRAARGGAARRRRRHRRTAQQDQRPLLVIAGAGSGKTSTLAHRVAHLIASGADPQRILLLTFSRRAAQEMERRAGQVLPRVLGLASEAPPALPWAGTFHGIGARLLREYAAQIGLDENFTIHDRGDAEDLMGLVRHDIGLSATNAALSAEGHLPVDLLARGQHLRAAGRGAEARLPLVRRMGGRTQAAVRRLRRGQAAAARARLRRPAAVLGRDDGRAGAGRAGRRALRPRAGRRIPGHQPAAGGHPARA